MIKLVQFYPYPPHIPWEQINLTLGAGSEINFAASTTLTQPVPEPSAIALLGGAILLVGRMIKKRA